MDGESIPQVLRERVDTARKRLDAASKHFAELIKETPSGLPPPDGAECLRVAARVYSEAQREVTEAFAQLNEFLIRGKTPPGLKDASRK